MPNFVVLDAPQTRADLLVQKTSPLLHHPALRDVQGKRFGMEIDMPESQFMMEMLEAQRISPRQRPVLRDAHSISKRIGRAEKEEDVVFRKGEASCMFIHGQEDNLSNKIVRDEEHRGGKGKGIVCTNPGDGTESEMAILSLRYKAAKEKEEASTSNSVFFHAQEDRFSGKIVEDKGFIKIENCKDFGSKHGEQKTGCTWSEIVRPFGEYKSLEEEWPALPPRSGLRSVGKGRAGKALEIVGKGPSIVKRQGDQSLCKEEKEKMPPILLMLNKDFIVASPLKQNLLLILALREGRRPEEDEGEITRANPEKERRQILVGHFTAFSSFLNFGLSRDATRVRVESNAGGTSTLSESLSVEYFVRRFQAKEVVTEMEVEYCSMNWKKVDYICTLYDQRVGVSVTRAMSFPDPKCFSSEMGYRLLYKKLFGLVVARHGVTKRYSFSQCILHVWCETQETARILEQQYEGVSQELDITDDVIMVLTVAEGSHSRPIFYEFLLKEKVS